MTNKEVAKQLRELAKACRAFRTKENAFWESEAGKIVLSTPSERWLIQEQSQRYDGMAYDFEMKGEIKNGNV